MKNPSLKTRKYAYRVVAAGLTYAALKGLVDGNESAALLLLAAAVLGLADKNAVDVS